MLLFNERVALDNTTAEVYKSMVHSATLVSKNCSSAIFFLYLIMSSVMLPPNSALSCKEELECNSSLVRGSKVSKTNLRNILSSIRQFRVDHGGQRGATYSQRAKGVPMGQSESDACCPFGHEVVASKLDT